MGAKGSFHLEYAYVQQGQMAHNTLNGPHFFKFFSGKTRTELKQFGEDLN